MSYATGIGNKLKGIFLYASASTPALGAHPAIGISFPGGKANQSSSSDA